MSRRHLNNDARPMQHCFAKVNENPQVHLGSKDLPLVHLGTHLLKLKMAETVALCHKIFEIKFFFLK